VSDQVNEIRRRWENTGQSWQDIPGQNYHTDIPVLLDEIERLRAWQSRVLEIVRRYDDASGCMGCTDTAKIRREVAALVAGEALGSVCDTGNETGKE